MIFLLFTDTSVLLPETGPWWQKSVNGRITRRGRGARTTENFFPKAGLIFPMDSPASKKKNRAGVEPHRMFILFNGCGLQSEDRMVIFKQAGRNSQAAFSR